MDKYNFFRQLLKFITWIDVGGVVLADGNIDTTVSGTTGYFYYETIKNRSYWTSMKWMIDTAFFPFDGVNHCYDAYKSDPNEDYEIRFKRLLWVITLLSCIIISLISYSYYILSKK